MSARNTALAALIACRKNDAWSDGVLKDYIRRDRLDSRGRGAGHAAVLWRRAEPAAAGFLFDGVRQGRTAEAPAGGAGYLRLGVYQIVFMDGFRRLLPSMRPLSRENGMPIPGRRV